jgi:transposase
MLIVETIAKIRRLFREHRSIREISRELRLSRKVVRKALRSDKTAFAYKRQHQPRPQLDGHIARLDVLLAEELTKPKRERLSLTRLFEGLRAEGYAGGYDAVRRYAQRWFAEHAATAAGVFVPLAFAPGEAYQFDWSHETVRLAGVTTQVKVAHIRLCHSRLFLLRAYPRETQEMVFDAHEHAFRFFGGSCQRGIYDNMRTAVSAIFVGRQRTFNRRFLQLCSHHLVEPTACNPSAGWEKGQVENQVRTARNRFFKPVLRFETLADLNHWLEEQCRLWAASAAHPVQRDRTVQAVFETEDRPALIPYRGAFDGFHEVEVVASKTCLVRYDYNRYSVAARVAGRHVQLRAYADRIAVFLNGEIVAEHARCFGRYQTIFNAWHYLPVLARKPGALRNGEPFRDWDLPGGLAQIRERLRAHADGDRQFVAILSAVPEAGLEAVEAACTAALAARLFSADAVLNLLARGRESVPPAPVPTPAGLTLGVEPAADCARYDGLRALETI